MFGVAASRPHTHRRLRGAFFSLVSAVLMLTIFSACRSTPEIEAPTAPPVTGVTHLDTALTIAFEVDEPLRSEIYVEVARSLAVAGDVLAAISVLEDVRVVDIETALLLSRGWNQIAAADDEYVLNAYRADEGFLAYATQVEDPRTRADYLLKLLSIQLDNENRSFESIRELIDELYFIPDDVIRVETLVEAAERIRRSGERVALTAVVQQAIAILPSIADPFLAATLSARLADLSRTIDRPQDTDSLLQAAVAGAESGLFVSESAVDDLGRLAEILTGFRGPDIAAAVAENVTPRAYRALTYAKIAAALPAGEVSDRFFDDSLLRATEIADADRRLRTQTEVILIRSDARPDWSPEDAVAATLQRADLPTQSPEFRLDVLTGLGTAYYLTGRPEGLDRLRGLIASSSELSALRVSIAQALFDRGREDAAASLLQLIDPSPETLIGFSTRPALIAANLLRELDAWDRAVQLLASATAAGIVSSGEAAVVIARIPADYDPDPVSRGQLERVLED